MLKALHGLLPAGTTLPEVFEALNTFVKECMKPGEALRKEHNAALEPEASKIG